MHYKRIFLTLCQAKFDHTWIHLGKISKRNSELQCKCITFSITMYAMYLPIMHPLLEAVVHLLLEAGLSASWLGKNNVI